MKNLNLNVVLVLIILAIGVLAYSSYLAGVKSAENDMDALLMTMTLDSNFVTAGLYEELPNEIRKTMSFYVNDTQTIVNDVKIYAQVRFVTIGEEVLDVTDGRIWDIIKRERVFQRQFKDTDDQKNIEDVPDSPYAEIR